MTRVGHREQPRFERQDSVAYDADGDEDSKPESCHVGQAKKQPSRAEESGDTDEHRAIVENCRMERCGGSKHACGIGSESVAGIPRGRDELNAEIDEWHGYGR